MEKHRPSIILPAAVRAISCPLLLHADGIVSWTNEAFSMTFGIRSTAVKNLKVRELLWCLGIQDPLAGMIAEGVTFDHWEAAAPLNPALSVLYMRQLETPSLSAEAQSFILLVSETPDLPALVSALDREGSVSE